MAAESRRKEKLVEKGLWRRTWSDGTTADLTRSFQLMHFVLRDLAFVDRMHMEVQNTARYVTEDRYEEHRTVEANGVFGTPIDILGLPDDHKARRIKEASVTLTFVEPWGYQAQKWKNLEPSEELWSVGESQAGRIHIHDRGFWWRTEWVEANRMVMRLLVPLDFLPRMREAIKHPERVSQIRVSVMAKLYGDCDYLYIDRDELDIVAYVHDLVVESVRLFKQEREEGAKEYSDALDRGPKTLPIADRVPIALAELKKALTACAVGLGVIAIILLVKLG
jgi:hypothetical protein